MSKTPKTDALIAGLTIEQAREWRSQEDQILWIDDNLLAPANLPTKMALKVEAALIALLVNAGESAE